jgi:hypothetical protein
VRVRDSPYRRVTLPSRRVAQAGGAALYLHRQPEQRRRLQSFAQEQLVRGEAALRTRLAETRRKLGKKAGKEAAAEPAPAPAVTHEATEVAEVAAPQAVQQPAQAMPHAAPRLAPHPLKGIADDDEELW